MRFGRMSSLARVLTGLAMTAFFWPGSSLAGTNHQGNQERDMSITLSTTAAESVKIPPMDTVAVAKTETATFALG